MTKLVISFRNFADAPENGGGIMMALRSKW
jgi:hypothetical protein